MNARSTLAILALTAAFGLACGQAPADRSDIETVSASTEEALGRGLIVGANAVHLMDGGEMDANRRDDATGEDIPSWLHTLRYARYLGARFIRVYGAYDPNDPIGRANAKAQQICGVYGAAGIPLLFSFSDKALEGPAHPRLIDVVHTWRDGSDEWKTTAHWQFASTVVQKVNETCPSAIYAWEIGNELLCKDCITDESQRRERMGWYESFLVRMPRELRKLTSARIALGLIRASWADHYRDGAGHDQPGYAWQNGQIVNLGGVVDWNRVYGNSAVSFITLHPYGGPAAWYDQPDWFEVDHELARRVGKRIMLEEFGAHPGTDVGQEGRRDSFLYWIDWAQRHPQVATIAPWQATFVGFENAGLNGLDGSCYPSGQGEGPRCEVEKRLRAIAQ